MTEVTCMMQLYKRPIAKNAVRKSDALGAICD
jgi:hypothetical protein